MAKSSGKRQLVIVESPTKAKTLERYLGDEYEVTASVGHVLDLPKSGLAVDVENGFEPQYQVIRGKGQLLKQLRSEAKKADAVLLAMDPDREGEAIAVHLAQQMGYTGQNDQKFRRVTFNEITREAVLEALSQPGPLNHDRADAQQARRILDRLVGYGLSPLLWKKISPRDPINGQALSAGRVQSVAVRFLVERERERRAFHRASYWDLKATLRAAAGEFEARLVSLDGKKIATGKDFDPATGALIAKHEVMLLGEEPASALRERLLGVEFKVASLEEEFFKTKPYAPFTTASLQQEASRKLRLTARDTMRAAQRLYEAGYITYMRTDSVRLSNQAITAARTRVAGQYGDEYLNPKPRTYKTSTRGAQEAHEAIRPAGVDMLTAQELGLAGMDKALYELIWKRTVASQMADSRQKRVSVLVEAADAVFQASGKTVEFAGYLRAYVEGADDPEAALEDRETQLPPVREEESVECGALLADPHETRPPARFTEAALLDVLKKEGIGRPSTYAPILGKIVDRGYARREARTLIPTFMAFAVTGLLEQHFPDLVDTRFTARMEDTLDQIAEGTVEWRDYLSDFYNGVDGFESRLKERESAIDPREASTLQLEGLEPSVRIGRFGPYLELTRDGEAITAAIPDGTAPADLTPEQATDLLRQKAESTVPIGSDPKSGLPVFKLTGRFGPYVQLGEQEDGGPKPRRASLPKGMTLDDVTLDAALRLLALPRDLGAHPKSGDPVKAGIGRYGPYVVHEGDFRSLTQDDDVLTVTLDRALALLAEPKRRGRTGAKPLRELGEHPSDGGMIQVFEGRYGPYVKHEKTNASLPKDLKVEDITLKQAAELIAARQARGPTKRSGKAGGKTKK